MIFNHTSWGKYLMVIALIVFAYYLAICLKYYGPNVLNRFFGKRHEFFPASEPYPGEGKANKAKQTAASSQTKKESDADRALENRVAPLLAETADVIHHIKEIISTLMAENYERSRILGSLHALLITYPHLKDTRIMSSINRLVASEFDKYGAYDLRDDELEDMWIE